MFPKDKNINLSWQFRSPICDLEISTKCLQVSAFIFFLNVAILASSGVAKSLLGVIYLLHMFEMDALVSNPVDQQKSS